MKENANKDEAKDEKMLACPVQVPSFSLEDFHPEQQPLPLLE